MRLGLYGGSFDPIHRGHLLVAQAAVEETGLDRLVFIPAAQSPFKSASIPAPGRLRARMLRLALARQPRYDVDEFELNRGGVSYTIDTVREFQRRHADAEIFWLIGADHVPTLPLWREAPELATRVTFVVIPRPGDTPAASPVDFRLQHLRGWPLRVSSSEIRARIAAGQAIDNLVPRAIDEMIQLERLYQAPAGAPDSAGSR